MPTVLPPRRKRRSTAPLFIVWALALCASGIALEWLDPAPLDVAAAWIVSP